MDNPTDPRRSPEEGHEASPGAAPGVPPDASPIVAPDALLSDHAPTGGADRFEDCCPARHGVPPERGRVDIARAAEREIREQRQWPSGGVRG